MQIAKCHLPEHRFIIIIIQEFDYSNIHFAFIVTPSWHFTRIVVFACKIHDIRLPSSKPESIPIMPCHADMHWNGAFGLYNCIFLRMQHVYVFRKLHSDRLHNSHQMHHMMMKYSVEHLLKQAEDGIRDVRSYCYMLHAESERYKMTN